MSLLDLDEAEVSEVSICEHGRVVSQQLVADVGLGRVKGTGGMSAKEIVEKVKFKQIGCLFCRCG